MTDPHKAKQPAPVQQEPVGVVNIESHSTHGWRVADFELTKALPFGRHSLYTAPPAQRTWVGLTNEEIAEQDWRLSADRTYEEWTLQEQLVVSGVKDFARAIEAKLKEKNT